MSERNPDCIVIGYNETPFDEYETLIRNMVTTQRRIET
jgi:hypothetical protein